MPSAATFRRSSAISSRASLIDVYGMTDLKIAHDMTALPFTAVAGCERAKRALLLLAVDPRLRGALLVGGPGTAKSTLARAFPALVARRSLALPAGTALDHLLGGLDLERTINHGRPVWQPGLLARAHGAVLLIDGVDRLGSAVASHIGDALETARVICEREGLSRIDRARFTLVGTYDPQEGSPAPSLVDRVGLIVYDDRESPVEERAEVLQRALERARDPRGFDRSEAAEMEAWRARIIRARRQARRDAVNISGEDLRTMAEAALDLGVEGHRVDLFALLAARASAALAGRRGVEREDLETALELVIFPRARRLAEPAREGSPRSESVDESQGEGPGEQRAAQGSATSERIILPIETPLPPHLLSGAGAGQTSAGKRGEAVAFERGRYVRAVEGQRAGRRVAIDATLRAAAPWQRARGSDLSDESRVIIRPSDLRFKVFRRRAGMLFIFAVDASGSMARNRIAQAKGALLRLLREAYVARDRVALIGFRGTRAEVLLAPTRAVERARRALTQLPVGGSTPLAAGILAALELWRRESRAGAQPALLVLLTDGRANVGARDQAIINEELDAVAAEVRRARLDSLVIDTEAGFTSRGEGEALAARLGGRYLRLPRAGAAAVYQSVRDEAGRLRRDPPSGSLH
jgi:magnesium chelatase subunit D